MTPHGDEKNIVDTLCTFFAVSSPKGWEDFYLNQRLRVAFSITLAEACDPYALSAWLRQGEIQAGEISIEAKYTAKLLRSILNDVVETENPKFLTIKRYWLLYLATPESR